MREKEKIKVLKSSIELEKYKELKNYNATFRALTSVIGNFAQNLAEEELYEIKDKSVYSSNLSFYIKTKNLGIFVLTKMQEGNKSILLIDDLKDINKELKIIELNQEESQQLIDILKMKLEFQKEKDISDLIELL